MLRTISLSSCISVQGMQVGQNADGTITVSLDGRMFTGMPVLPARRDLQPPVTH